MKIFLRACIIVLLVGNAQGWSAAEGSTEPVEKSPSHWQKFKEAVQKKRERKPQEPSTEPMHAQDREGNQPFYVHREDSTDPFALDEKNQHVRILPGSDVDEAGKTKK